MLIAEKTQKTKAVGLLLVLVLLLLYMGELFAAVSRADLESRLVSIAIDNGRVGDILKLLAVQNDLNLSVSDEVEGSISISLVDVTLADALDVITASASANWYITGNVVVVKPVERVDLQELHTKLFRLQYISASAAQKVVTPLIPAGSKVEILSRGNGEDGGWDEIIEVTACPVVINKVEKVIKQIDKQRPLVEIEAKIIETNVNDDNKLGIDFPDNFSVNIGDLKEDDEELNAFATHPLKGGRWNWGRLSAAEVTLLLDVLIQNGRSKLVSNPRITTVSNRQAEIEVTTTIPVQTMNRFSEAGVVQDIVSFQDLDVSISLLVTPRVSEDSTITLDVTSVVEEIIGYTGPIDNQRPITSKRSVISSITVKAGESLGLGGLMKEVEHKTIKKLPILGDMPVLGRVFQHHTTSVEKTDLLILITPHILGEP